MHIDDPLSNRILRDCVAFFGGGAPPAPKPPKVEKVELPPPPPPIQLPPPPPPVEMPKPQSQREIFAKTQPDVLMRKFEAKAKESRTAESDLTTQGRLREAQRMGSQAGMYEQRAEKWRAKAAIVNPLSLIPPPTPPPPPAPIPPIPTTSSLEAEQAAEDIRKQQGRRRGSYRSLLAGETGGFRPTATPRGSLLGGG